VSQAGGEIAQGADKGVGGDEQMTPEKQRAAIAEACGIVTHDQWGPLYKTPQGLVRVCPDFTGDLNAMHEAENFLFPVEISDLYGPDLVKEYASYLPHMCIGHPGGAMRATASQRAEAFLRTIGKWEDQ